MRAQTSFLIALTFLGGCGGDNEHPADGEQAAVTSELTTYDCVGTTTVVSTVPVFESCYALSFDGYGYLCTPSNGCSRDLFYNCQGSGGAWVTKPGTAKVSCSAYPVSQCTSHPGCSLAARCVSHCEGSTLTYCSSNTPYATTCPNGCAGADGQASCVLKQKQLVACDSACTWSYATGNGGGGFLVESYQATNTCNNTWKDVYYDTGVCAPGITPCQTLNRIQCWR